MREFETILLGFKWGLFFAASAALVWLIRNLDLFPRKRLKNTSFGKVKVGQTFFDYGGDELQLREYVKTDEKEAKCMNVSGNPLAEFNEEDTVKIETFRLARD